MDLESDKAALEASQALLQGSKKGSKDTMTVEDDDSWMDDSTGPMRAEFKPTKMNAKKKKK